MRRLMIVFFYQSSSATFQQLQQKKEILYQLSFPSLSFILATQLHLLVYCDRSQETSYAVLSSIIITLDDTIFLSFFLYFFSLLSVLLALLLFLYYYDQFKFSSLHHRQFFPSSSATIIHQSVHNQRHRVDRQARIFRRFGVKRRKAFVDHHA